MEISLKRLPGGRAPSCGNMMAQSDLDLKETALKEDLKFYFMNPCDKYRARHQIPWKLALQILKIVMVTSQLVFFGLSNQLVVSFKEENTVAFKHLFLKGYSGVDEDDYSCSIYTQQDAYDSIFYVIDQATAEPITDARSYIDTSNCKLLSLAKGQVSLLTSGAVLLLNQYRQLKNISLGTLGYEHDGSGLKICKQQYRKGGMLPSNDKPNIDVSTETDCITLKPQELASKNTEVKLNSSFFNLEFYSFCALCICISVRVFIHFLKTFRLIQVTISFKLKGVALQTIHARELPDCYAFQNTVSIELLSTIELTVEKSKSILIVILIFKNAKTGTYLVLQILWAKIGYVNIEHCYHTGASVHIFLARRPVTEHLNASQQRFVNFFLEKYNRCVSYTDRMEFINGWYVLVIISDVMTIIGSILKMEIKAK
ncbi:hypothetical protein CIB84_005241, partial [Bambusicola thoracicus]